MLLAVAGLVAMIAAERWVDAAMLATSIALLAPRLAIAASVGWRQR